MDFIDKDNVNQKGQVACLISTSDEIILTEMLYKGEFNDLDPATLAAMLSCFMVNENTKSESKPLKNPIFGKLYNRIRENAGMIADILMNVK